MFRKSKEGGKESSRIVEKLVKTFLLSSSSMEEKRPFLVQRILNTEL